MKFNGLFYRLIVFFSCLAMTYSWSADTIKQLNTYLQKQGLDQKLAEQSFASDSLNKADAIKAQDLIWEAYKKQIRKARADEMKAKRLVMGDLSMRFEYKIFGEKPEGGRSLYISMHGGGGGPARMNDQQWMNQIRLYQPKEGVYLAPRAPGNTWDLWHKSFIDKFFLNLIEMMHVFEDVDLNKVYLMGYSAGGDGCYKLAPRMAYRFAAAAMMAGHPNGVSVLSLRNLPFIIQMGEKDGAYKRNEVAVEYGRKLDALQKTDPKGYIHKTVIHKGMGHWMNRKDALALPWMAQYKRNPFPKRIVWHQDGVTHNTFYCLAVSDEHKSKGTDVIVQFEGQTVSIEKMTVKQLTIHLNDSMLDLDKEITLSKNGKKQPLKLKRQIKTIVSSLYLYRDRNYLFPVRVTLK